MYFCRFCIFISLLLPTVFFAKPPEINLANQWDTKFDLMRQKNENNYDKLSKKWISNIRLGLTNTKKSRDKKSKNNLNINYNQPIFQSGGIYYGMQFASQSYKLNTLSLQAEKTKLYKKNLLAILSFKRNALKIKKQKLALINIQISVKKRKEQFLNGLLDIGFLNADLLK